MVPYVWVVSKKVVTVMKNTTLQAMKPHTKLLVHCKDKCDMRNKGSWFTRYLA